MGGCCCCLCGVLRLLFEATLGELTGSKSTAECQTGDVIRWQDRRAACWSCCPLERSGHRGRRSWKTDAPGNQKGLKKGVKIQRKTQESTNGWIVFIKCLICKNHTQIPQYLKSFNLCLKWATVSDVQHIILIEPKCKEKDFVICKSSEGAARQVYLYSSFQLQWEFKVLYVKHYWEENNSEENNLLKGHTADAPWISMYGL